MTLRTYAAAVAATAVVVLGASHAFAATGPVGAAPAAETAVAHQHDTAGHPGLTLDNGRKWATDLPLRRNMDAIRTLMATRLPGIRGGTLPASDYEALGRTVEGHVADIVGNCKLTPEADAVLHVIVAQLLAGADQMKAGNDAAAGADKVVSAANDYGEYFEHPGWTRLG